MNNNNYHNVYKFKIIDKNYFLKQIKTKIILKIIWHKMNSTNFKHMNTKPRKFKIIIIKKKIIIIMINKHLIPNNKHIN